MMEIASAVRLPTPEPIEHQYGSATKRKRGSLSRSRSPRRTPAEPTRSLLSDEPRLRQFDHDGKRLSRPAPRDRQESVERYGRVENGKMETKKEPRLLTAQDKQAAAKKEYEALLNKRSGGVYIPPARLKELQGQITDQTSREFQRMAWEALKKSINGLINKVNIGNIKCIVPELFGENLIRGRGLFCRSIMKAQAASLPFTPIFAATAAIVNTKLPQVGELLLHRLVISFRKAFKRNDKSVCISTTTFLAHLVNQQVCHEMLAAQLLLLLLHKPSDDGVEIAVNLVKECGQHLEEMSGPIALAVFDQFRNILHEADSLEKRTQYMIEVLFQVRKDKWKEFPAVKEELDLVEEEDQITHKVDLDGQLQVQDGLNIFKFDPNYQEGEEAYKKLKAEILGEGSEDEADQYDSDASSQEDEADDEDEKDKAMEIKDQTNTDLVNLRRTIYLTIKSSGTFEEACHKLMRISLPPGQEDELPSMIIECASQERTFDKFYGNIGERCCKLNRLWSELFQEQFVKYYETIHRLETNRLRIIAQFFGHLLASDAIVWQVLSIIHLNEDETTSSSRIFIKILFEELVQAMGQPTLLARLKDHTLQPSLDGIFPKDNPKNIRFSINFFTAIGIGILTEDMREYIKNIPQPTVPALPANDDTDTETASTYSSYSSRSRSPSQSESRSPSRSRSRSPPRHRGAGHSRNRSPAYSSSRSPPQRRVDAPVRRGRPQSYSASPPRHNGRRTSPLLSRSPTGSRSSSPRRLVGHRGRSPTQSRPARSRSSRPRTRRRYSTSHDSLSRSPPHRDALNGRDQPAARRRRNSSSNSRDQPAARRRRNSSSNSRDQPVARRRRNSSSNSRRSPRRR